VINSPLRGVSEATRQYRYVRRQTKGAKDGRMSRL
jgi:hypothetical protein